MIRSDCVDNLHFPRQKTNETRDPDKRKLTVVPSSVEMKRDGELLVGSRDDDAKYGVHT